MKYMSLVATTVAALFFVSASVQAESVAAAKEELASAIMKIEKRRLEIEIKQGYKLRAEAQQHRIKIREADHAVMRGDASKLKDLEKAITDYNAHQTWVWDGVYKDGHASAAEVMKSHYNTLNKVIPNFHLPLFSVKALQSRGWIVYH